MLRDVLVKMIITDEMTFTSVDKVGFCKFVHTVEPQLSSWYTMIHDSLNRHVKEKVVIKEMFVATSQKVSFTTDIWTFIHNMDYMYITVYFIDIE